MTLLFFLVVLTVLPAFNAEHLPLAYHRHPHRRALPGTWSYQGCYTDSTSGRTLTGPLFVDQNSNTVESCVAECDSAGFYYAGVEYGKQCFCGNYIQNAGTPAPAPDCSFPCPGNAAEKCGAGGRMNLYSKGGSPPTPPATSQWQSIGCWTDSITARSLTVRKTVTGGMAVEKCQAACSASAYTLSGVEYSVECYCGNAFSNNPSQKADTECNMACTGNTVEQCGAPNRLNVYKFTAPPTAQWNNLGCISDSVGSRSMSVKVTVAGGVDTQSCQTACLNAGYRLAGTEYTSECYCDSQFRNGGVSKAIGDCNMVCAADATKKCGGPNRLNAYYWTGAVSPPPLPSPPPPLRPSSTLSSSPLSNQHYTPMPFASVSYS